MKEKNKTIWLVIGAVLIAGISFFVGMQFGKTGTQTNGQAQFANNGQRMQYSQNGQQNRMRNGGMNAGEITAKDDKSITIKAMDGSSKFVFFSDTTKIAKSTDGTKDDLSVGKSITVNGTANADGSITAQSIQIRTEPFGPRPQ